MTTRVISTGRRVRRPTGAELSSEYTAACRNSENIYAVTEIVQVLTPYAAALESNILFWNQHGSSSNVLEPVEEAFNVIFWSAPLQRNHRATETKYKVVFGYELSSGQDDGHRLQSTDRIDAEIVEDDEGTPVAILKDNALHILFDLPHREHYLKEVLSEIMDKVLEMKKIPTPSREEKRRARLLEMVERFSGGGVMNQLIISKRARLQSITRTLTSYSNEIMNLANQVGECKKEIEMAEAAKRSFNAQNMIDTLLSIPGVVSVAPYRNSLRVTTGDIFIDTDVARYNLGRFYIDYSEGNYRIHNADTEYQTRIGGYDHPHVMEGKPCLGNMAEIAVNVANGELDIATTLILDFLRSYNPPGAFVQVDRFRRIANFVDGKLVMLDKPIEFGDAESDPSAPDYDDVSDDDHEMEDD